MAFTLKHGRPKLKNGYLQKIKDFHCLDSDSEELGYLDAPQTTRQLRTTLRAPEALKKSEKNILSKSQKLLLLMFDKSCS